MFAVTFVANNSNLAAAMASLTSNGIANIDVKPLGANVGTSAPASKPLVEFDPEPIKKQKKYKERVYEVEVGPTTPAKAQELTALLKSVFGREQGANMHLKSDIMINRGPDSNEQYLTFKVWYGARGNCPADVRGFVKRRISVISVTVNVKVNGL